MATKPKMKGLFKGLRYISQIFEEEKEDEIQIGFPTDVKHVAHIGWDGPTVESPSWMKEFSSSTQSAPLGPPIDHKGDPEIKWVSEDSNTKRSNRPTDSDVPDVPKSSPKKKDSTSKSSRQQRRKDSSEGSVKSSNRNLPESTDSPSRGLPTDPAKKSRRKKSRESNGTGGSTRSRSKAAATCSDGTAADNDSGIQTSESKLDPIPTI